MTPILGFYPGWGHGFGAYPGNTGSIENTPWMYPECHGQDIVQKRHVFENVWKYIQMQSVHYLKK